AVLHFTPANALVPQAVTVTGVDDHVIDGDQSYAVAFAVGGGSDPAYLVGLHAFPVVPVTNRDNDKPAICAVAPGPGGAPVVRVYDALTGAPKFALPAYAPSFTGGVRVAVGDVTGDGRPDVITGTASGAPHVKVFDGLTGVEVMSFYAYDPAFRGGV